MAEDKAMGGVGRIASLSLAAVSAAAAVGLACAQPGDQIVAKPAASCARPDFRVVLDVGHTVDSPGAKSARGIDEYEFNLRLAKQIDRALLDAGFAKTVLMVTGGPGIRSMYVRVARANELSANLLLSIHHDSAPKAFLGKWDFNGKPEVFNDRFKGYSIFVSDDNIDQKDSLLFGSLLGNQLKIRGLQYTPHYAETFMGHYQHPLLDADAGVYRYDTLFVLKKTAMPAVLLEAGSIVNRDEEMLLEKPARQDLISAAVVDAVESFCVAQATKPALIAQSARRKQKIAHHARSRHARKKAADDAVVTMVQSTIDAH
jgi:N-acetylmuramoyl-L-alanine amidase